MNVPVPDGRRRALLLATLLLLLVAFAGSVPPAIRAADPDPAAAGPFATRHVDFHAGMIALTLPKGRHLKASFNQPLRGSIDYPASGRDWPVVLFLHGRHGTCIDDRGRDFIPFPGDDNPNCPDSDGTKGRPGERRIRSYAGYRYLSERLATQGYMVVSADANKIASYEFVSSRAGVRARSQLVGAVLDLVGRWDSGTEPVVNEEKSRPLIRDLAGRLDLGHIALMGHSRGGDAVTQFVAFNQKRKTVYPLDGVVAIGPTDNSGANPFRNGGTNLAEILPACDGDVFDLPGGHVFERVKNTRHGAGFSKFQWLVGGANHNWFNTVWKQDDARSWPATDLDSACGRRSGTSTRLSRSGQRAVALELITGFIRTFAGGESGFGPALQERPPDSGIRSSFVAPSPERRLIIGPGPASATSRNELGGPIRKQGLSLNWCDPTENAFFEQIRRCPGPTGGDESTVNRSWTRQLVVEWKRKSSFSTDLPPASADASAYRDLVFRAVTTLSRLNPDRAGSAAASQQVDVVLADRTGHRASVAAETYSSALYPAAGDRTRQLLLGDVRIPLADFAGVDLKDLASVGFEFGNRGRTHGQIQIADLAFQGAAGSPARAENQAGRTGPVPGPGTAVDAILTATSSGSRPPDGSCVAGPVATISSSPEVAAGSLSLSGRLSSPDCEARVQISLFEPDGELCRFYSEEGRPGPARDCGDPYSLIPTVGDDGSWKLTIPWADTLAAPEVELAAIPL